MIGLIRTGRLKVAIENEQRKTQLSQIRQKTS
jgi:hypothetical protein